MLERKGRAQAPASGWILRRAPGHGKCSHGTVFFFEGFQESSPRSRCVGRRTLWTCSCCLFILGRCSGFLFQRRLDERPKGL